MSARQDVTIAVSFDEREAQIAANQGRCPCPAEGGRYTAFWSFCPWHAGMDFGRYEELIAEVGRLQAEGRTWEEASIAVTKPLSLFQALTVRAGARAA